VAGYEFQTLSYLAVIVVINQSSWCALEMGGEIFSYENTGPYGVLHSIVVRPTAVRAISTDTICQAIVQHCRASDLELTATRCVKLRLSLSLSLYFQIQT